MKQLTIDVVANAYTREERVYACAPPVVVARTFEVVLTFTLKLNGKKARGLVVTMEARDRWQMDDELREELKSNYRIEPVFHAEAIDEIDDPMDDMIIEIIDPTGFLKWFGLDAAEDIFKNAKHDKPVRLPAAHSG